MCNPHHHQHHPYSMQWDLTSLATMLELFEYSNFIIKHMTSSIILISICLFAYSIVCVCVCVPSILSNYSWSSANFSQYKYHQNMSRKNSPQTRLLPCHLRQRWQSIIEQVLQKGFGYTWNVFDELFGAHKMGDILQRCIDPIGVATLIARIFLPVLWATIDAGSISFGIIL